MRYEKFKEMLEESKFKLFKPMQSTKDFEKLSIDLARFKHAVENNGSSQVFGATDDWGDTFIHRQKNNQREAYEVMQQIDDAPPSKRIHKDSLHEEIDLVELKAYEQEKNDKHPEKLQRFIEAIDNG